ncbi:isoquinoline 1-oxidoreductase, beta subunit domain protein [Burkholderia pseudomallei]|nr:isoquinoline 1-oxidoreductase, beta subunit domain protein [Burkholderia pseudomallei]
MNASATAIPRPRPFGSGLPGSQPAFSAASSSTPFRRGACASRSRRNRYGSLPAACAASSMNASTAYAVCELPTTRHHSTGTADRVVVSSTDTFGIA